MDPRDEHVDTLARLEQLHARLARLERVQARHRPRPWAPWLIATVLMLLGSALTAGAQSIGDSLVTFYGGQPARAADVNFNFQLLKAWIEDKVGAVGTPTSIGTGGPISAGSLSTTGGIKAIGDVTTWAGVSAAVGERHGFVVDGHTDPFFIGSVARAAGSDNAYDAVLAWGDDPDDLLRFESNQCCGNGTATAMSLDWAGNATLAGNLTANSNTWDSSDTFTTWQAASECSNQEYVYDCPDGMYVCGIRMRHECGVQWWARQHRVRCCSL